MPRDARAQRANETPRTLTAVQKAWGWLADQSADDSLRAQNIRTGHLSIPGIAPDRPPRR